MVMAGWAHGASVEVLPLPSGLDRIAFKGSFMNSRGDFVTVSRTSIVVGNIHARWSERVFFGENYSFYQNIWDTVNFDPQRLDVSIDIYGGRMALNESGNFIAASARGLFVGSVSDKSIREIYKGELGQEFQEVVITNSGYFLASTYKSLLGGHIHDQAPARLLATVPGNFGTYHSYGSLNRYDAAVGMKHLAINDKGQFIATSTRAIFAGELAPVAVDKVYEDQAADFTSISLAADGSFLVQGQKKLVRGQLGQ